ncbi:MAG: T9SS type A sorting domain-containing protein [Candidatus Coatesbacteria bacterium]|nr:T9SS type A sorting domain-containing protein [Candidatus Coatesbacteria bacterium]
MTKHVLMLILIGSLSLLFAQNHVLYRPEDVLAGLVQLPETVKPYDYTNSVDGVSLDPFQNAANQPTVNCRGAGCFYGGKHYVFGGFGASDTDKPSWSYDHNTNTWANYTPQLPNNCNNTAFTFTGTKFFVFGSYPSSRVIQILDFTTSTWNTSRTIPTNPAVPYVGHQGCYIGGGKHFITGGYTPQTKHSWIYDDVADSWISAADWPGTGSYLYFNNNCAFYNGKVYTVGGYNGSTAGYTGVHIYDPVTNTWATGPTLPGGVNFNTAVSNQNGIYNVGSGYSSYGPARTNIYFLQQGQGSWVDDEPLPQARGSMPNASFDSFNLLVSGGTSGSSRMGTAWYATGRQVGFYYKSKFANYIPTKSEMLKIYPNPSRANFLFGFTLSDNDHMKVVNITIYDISGRALKTIVNSKKSFGNHGVYWYTDNVRAGVYIYKMTVGNKLITSGRVTKL